MTLAGLGWLAGSSPAAVPQPVLADILRGLERASSVLTAARSKVLAAFAASGGYESDGHGSPRTWLTWQTRVSRSSADAALAWVRRLHEHSAVADALAAGQVSQSWAKCVCDWTDQLPEDARAGADVILLAAAQGGAELADLARLAAEIRARTAQPDRDDGDGFEDRRLRLATTMGPLGGAGYLTGELTPACAAALRAILDSLGKKAGPEDTRSQVQRDHDALAEACRRLLAADSLPDRAGQPVKIEVQMTLDQLLARWQGSGEPASADPVAWPGAECDAQIAPVVTGHVDHDLLDRLAAGLAQRTGAASREQILATAVALLSGPGRLASVLRTGTVPGPAASVSLPLDLGKPTEVIPPHLRRAVILRDKQCAAPGCDRPPSACQVHHIMPRAQGGPTRLTNLLLLCTFHHEILVHRWGWTICLNADGTTTMTSPGGRRVYNSHAPPCPAA